MPILSISQVRARFCAKKAQELKQTLDANSTRSAQHRLLTALTTLKNPSNRPVFTHINQHGIENISKENLLRILVEAGITLRQAERVIATLPEVLTELGHHQLVHAPARELAHDQDLAEYILGQRTGRPAIELISSALPAPRRPQALAAAQPRPAPQTPDDPAALIDKIVNPPADGKTAQMQDLAKLIETTKDEAPLLSLMQRLLSRKAVDKEILIEAAKALAMRGGTATADYMFEISHLNGKFRIAAETILSHMAASAKGQPLGQYIKDKAVEILWEGDNYPSTLAAVNPVLLGPLDPITTTALLDLLIWHNNHYRFEWENNQHNFQNHSALKVKVAKTLAELGSKKTQKATASLVRDIKRRRTPLDLKLRLRDELFKIAEIYLDVMADVKRANQYLASKAKKHDIRSIIPKEDT